MSDKSLTISSFKYGLDTRRESLASLPGTLQTLQNAFINSGGEIEKRRAFVLVGTIPNGASGFPASGLQDTDTGIMVFSSDADPGGLPTNIVWQQLTFPYSLTAPGNLALVYFSTAFNGKAFALVEFLNEPTPLAYFNGTIVQQISDGFVLSNGTLTPETLSDLAKDLARIVSNIPGWIAHANVTNLGLPSDSPIIGYNETAFTGSVLIMTPVGVRVTPVVTNIKSTLGLIGVRLVDQDYPGIPGAAAVVGFQIGSSGSNTGNTINVSAPAKIDGSNVISITNGTVPFNAGGLGQTAQDIATAINNYTFVSGYTAYAVNTLATVVIFAPVGFGNFTKNLTITTAGSPDHFTIACVNPVPPPSVAGYSMTITPQSLNIDASGKVQPGPVGNISAATTAQTSPVTFKWEKTSTDIDSSHRVIWSTDGWRTAGGVNGVTSVTGPTCAIEGFMPAGGAPYTANFKVTAHNSTQPDVVMTFFVRIYQS